MRLWACRTSKIMSKLKKNHYRKKIFAFKDMAIRLATIFYHQFEGQRIWENIKQKQNRRKKTPELSIWGKGPTGLGMFPLSVPLYCGQGSSSGFAKPVNHEVLYRKKIWGGGACKTKMGRKVISLKVKLCNDWLWQGGGVGNLKYLGTIKTRWV